MTSFGLRWQHWCWWLFSLMLWWKNTWCSAQRCKDIRYLFITCILRTSVVGEERLHLWRLPKKCDLLWLIRQESCQRKRRHARFVDQFFLNHSSTLNPDCPAGGRMRPISPNLATPKRSKKRTRLENSPVLSIQNTLVKCTACGW